MNRTRGVGRAVFVFSLCLAGSAAFADPPQRPFDFTDAFYIANGVDPAEITGRSDGTPPNSIIDNSNTNPNRRNVRIRSTFAAFDDTGHHHSSGDPMFFNVFGNLPHGFLNNAAGQEALQIAEAFPLYTFPRATNGPFVVLPRRQEEVVPEPNCYSCNNPLGLWTLNFVRYTPAATGTPAGQAALAALADRNGLDLDGTPIIRSQEEIQDLAGAGFVQIVVAQPNVTPGYRWVIAPIEDPRNGAIAPDAFLVTVNEANCQPIPASQELRWEFNCLQVSGDFCDRIPPCVADFNNDGNVTVADFGAMQTSFMMGQNAADLNLDCVLTVADFGAFQTAFVAGCSY